MASQSEGIQRLLEAEKEAQKDIDAARRRKLKFLSFVNLLPKLRIKNWKTKKKILHRFINDFSAFSHFCCQISIIFY